MPLPLVVWERPPLGIFRTVYSKSMLIVEGREAQGPFQCKSPRQPEPITPCLFTSDAIVAHVATLNLRRWTSASPK